MNEWSFFVLREDNKVFESKMAVSESNMAEFKMAAIKSKMAKLKMAAIIKLSENEWVWIRLNWFESESEWSESIFEWIWEKITRCLNPIWQCLNPTWQYSRWLPSWSWVRKNEWSFFVQMVGINAGNCEWVWKEKLRWLIPRRPNSRWQNSRWLPSSIQHGSWVRKNEWSFFVQMVGINVGNCKWVWKEKLRWLNPRWPNSRWLPSSSLVRMNEFDSDWFSLSQSQSEVRVFLSESERK